ncbi:MAG: hypothetical protein ACREV7_12000 [Steroidobacteraceae bacterium]
MPPYELLSPEANRKWKTLLAEYQPPPLDPAKDEQLRLHRAKEGRHAG